MLWEWMNSFSREGQREDQIPLGNTNNLWDRQRKRGPKGKVRSTVRKLGGKPKNGMPQKPDAGSEVSWCKMVKLAKV